jgi:actin related protein 2/3 complex, subunit 1A/1B
MAPEVFSLSQTAITSHAFNADRSSSCSSITECQKLISSLFAGVAVSFNSNEAHILARQGKEWVSTDTLSEVSERLGCP